jgi:hypothetical protein
MKIHFQVGMFCLGLVIKGASPASLTFAPASLDGLLGKSSISKIGKWISGEMKLNWVASN